MRIPTVDEVRRLAAHERPLCISLYMPAHRGGPEAEQDRLHLKNRLMDADRLLKAHGLASSADRDRILAHGRALLDDPAFWRHQSDGLAVLMDDEELFEEFRVPIAVEELSVVAPRLLLTPLLPAIESGSEFYVLAVSRKRVRWLRGTRYALEEIDLPGAPQGLGDLFAGVEVEPGAQLQLHTVGSPEGAAQAAVFHGHGNLERPATEMLMLYFRRLADATRRALSGESAPLIFAGDVSLFPLYRQANQYAHLQAEFIAGNPDGWNGPEIHARAWPIVQNRLDAERGQARAFVGEALARQRGTDDPAALVRSAREGRVHTLLVAARQHLWGRYDPGDGAMTVRNGRAWDCEDLVNLCATIAVHSSAARVFVTEPVQMPSRSPVAAAFRY